MKRTIKPPITRIKCHFCGTNNPFEFNGENVLLWAHNHGWDWFTGNLNKTIRVCPDCRKTGKHHKLFEISISKR